MMIATSYSFGLLRVRVNIWSDGPWKGVGPRLYPFWPQSVVIMHEGSEFHASKERGVFYIDISLLFFLWMVMAHGLKNFDPIG